MVKSILFKNPKMAAVLEEKSIANHYFLKFEKPNAEGKTHRCKLCNKNYKAYIYSYYFSRVSLKFWVVKIAGTGYTSQMQHVKAQHSDYEKVVREALSSGQNMDTIESLWVSKKGRNAYCWLDFIINGNHPFTCVEDPLTLKYVHMKPISYKTFMKYMKAVTEVVERKIKKKLPKKFGLAFDGWSHGSKHYLVCHAYC
jgi:hypothetical protein